MLKRFAPIFVVSAVLACAFFALRGITPGPVQGQEEPAAKAQSQGPGAFDVVKMGRHGGRMGPVYFAHEVHADLPGQDGKNIACSACHRDACGSPRRCGECHVPAPRGTRPKVPST